jgi:sporulation protein YlmC with PRC-barrel domain
MKINFATVLGVSAFFLTTALPCPSRAVDEPAAAAPAVASPVTDRLEHSLRFSQLIEAPIFSRDGAKIGRVDDLVVDLTDGGILCVRAEPNEVYGDFHVLIPVRMITAAAETGLVMAGDKTNLIAAPQLPDSVAELPDLAKAVRSSFAYFAQPPPWTAGNIPASLARFHTLSATPVRNGANATLGDLKDVLVDITGGRIFFLVVSSVAPEPGLYAVPPAAATVARPDGSAVVDAARSKISTILPEGEFIWQQMRDPAWAAKTYRFFGVEPNFGPPPAVEAAATLDSVNLFPRIEGSDITVTVANPAGRTDAGITRDIIAEIENQRLDESQLTITTSNGRVTLSGIAKDSDARAKLLSIAEAIAGRGNVDDRLQTAP